MLHVEDKFQVNIGVTEELEELFKALANVNRLLLIYSLASGEVEKISVTEMSREHGHNTACSIATSQNPEKRQHPHCQKRRKLHLLHDSTRRSMQKNQKRIDFLFTCAFAKCHQLEKSNCHPFERKEE